MNLRLSLFVRAANDDVLSRPKFNFAKENIEAYLDQVEHEGVLVSVKPLKNHLPGPDDEPFLEVALSEGVIAIVTGNKRHFPRKDYQGMKILSPVELLEAMKEKI